jgi:hypothetical protein
MRAKSIHRVLPCLLVALATACGASAPPRQTSGRVEPARSQGGYDFRKEGAIPPPAGGGARAETDVEEMAITDSGLEVTEADAPRDTLPPPTAPADSTADGFRIQLFASSDREVAHNARAVAGERLGVPAYLDLEGGVYKVRVGDYVRREDAVAALPGVRGHDYPDAWIVPARVNVARPR